MTSEEKIYDLVLRAYPLMEQYLGELRYEILFETDAYDEDALEDIEKEYLAVKEWCFDAKGLLGK